MDGWLAFTIVTGLLLALLGLAGWWFWTTFRG
jgi:hypothetical protein